MNFIEAALLLLKKSRRALTAEQIVEQAESEDLLAKPGKDPQRSIKAALSRELKKGDDSRVVQVGDDRFKLAKGAAQDIEVPKPAKATKPAAKATKPAAKKKAATKKTATKTAARKTEARKPAEETEARKPAKAKKPGRSRKTRDAADEAVELVEVVDTAPADQVEAVAVKDTVQADGVEAVVEAPAAGEARPSGRKRRSRRGRRRRGGAEDTAAAEITPDTVVEAAPVDVAPVADDASVEVAEVLAPREQPVRVEPAGAPAEDDVEAIYGDELSGTEPGAAFAEYRDAQTEDEDRPMMPEIVATRRDRHKRERRRREPREGRERRRETRPERAAEARPERAPEARPEARVERTPARAQLELELPSTAAGLATYQPGNVIGQGAVEVLRESNGQPTRAKQIALMMRKRELLDGDPEKLWPHVKAALLSDEQDHLARGIRPRVVHRGRDQFALADTPAEPALREAEEVMERAAVAMAAATHAVVKARLGALGLVALERVAHVLLIRQGWQQIEWIKRAQRSSYAVAEAPEGLGTMLVGVRAGGEPVDRRGVGELRVGIQAKNLPGGLLLSPQPLSDVARQELRRNGPSISLLVGDAFVSSLIQSSIGVRAGHVPVNLVDETFFREVSID